MQRIYVPYQEVASNLMREADILLFSGVSLISSFIRRFTSSQYSHIGLYSVNTDGVPEILEFREWKGGIKTPFADVLKQYNRQIDVYRPVDLFQGCRYNKRTHCLESFDRIFKPKRVTNTFRSLLGLPYGWKRIFFLSRYYLLGFRLIYYNGGSTDDEKKTNGVFPVCSTAVAHAYSINGFDLVKNRSDERTTPGDISMSGRLSYLFTPVF